MGKTVIEPDMDGNAKQPGGMKKGGETGQPGGMDKGGRTGQPGGRVKNSGTMDMTQGTIWKELIIFSLPLLAGNIFQQLYNTVDSIVVGNFVGPDALGAVTSLAPAINTLIGLFIGFTAGASVVVSQYFGAGRIPELRRSVHTAVVASFWLGLFIMAAGWFITPGLISFMQTPDEIRPLAITYLRIYFAGILGLVFYNIGSAILRAVGDSRHPLYFLILTSVLNVFLDLLFVIRFHMGVAGVAYATILSQFISAAAIFVLLFRSRDVFSVRLQELHIDTELLKKIILIGLPTGIQMALTSFSNVFVMSYINRFGAASTSGWGTYGRIDAFVMLPLQSIAIASTTFTGQNAGADRPDRIRKCVSTAMLLGVAFTAALCIPEFIIAPQMIGFFSRDPDVIAYGVLFIRVNCLFDMVAVTNQVHAGVLRGIGDAQAPMIIMLGSFVVFRQIYLFIVSHLTDSIYPIAIAYPVGWVVCSIAMFAYFRMSRWQKKVDALGSR
jgi:putative MATE family efflux protein